MDKILYMTLGVGVMIIAAVDQVDQSAAPERTLRHNQKNVENAAFTKAETDSTWSANAQPYHANKVAPPAPVNPIPRAEDLGGKVISDRFQGDG